MKEEWMGHGLGILIIMTVTSILGSVLSALSQPFPQAIIVPFLMIAGAGSIFVARLPLYRQGKFWSVGPQALPQKSRKWYWAGYALFGVGAVWTLLFIVLALR